MRIIRAFKNNWKYNYWTKFSFLRIDKADVENAIDLLNSSKVGTFKSNATKCQHVLQVNWLNVLFMSSMRFRVNPHSIVAWMSRNSLLEMQGTPCLKVQGTPCSQHSSIICPVWLNSWVFVYELSGCRFPSSCSSLRLYGLI